MSLASASSPIRLAANLDDVRAAITRHGYREHPEQWVADVLGEFAWSKQRETMQSVVRYRRTAVHSCHDIGKSWTASTIAVWWIATHRPGEAFVVTTATRANQIKAIIWKEIGRIHAKSKLPGRVNQTEWWQTMPAGNEEMVAFGFKPSEYDPTAAQGIHAKYVLVIIDEACGLPVSLWEALDSLMANEYSRMLAVGNPDDPTSEFAEVCKPGSGWNVIGIGAWDTPNFTGEVVPDSLRDLLISPVWVEEKRRKWGESNPLYISKVLGKFPTVTNDGLIPIAWITAAQQQSIIPANDEPLEYGVDVGGGTARSTIAARRGGYVRVIHRDREPSTMKFLGKLLAFVKGNSSSPVLDMPASIPSRLIGRPAIARVDNVGIGKGVVDRAAEIASDQSKSVDQRSLARLITGVNVGKPAYDSDAYVNARAEGYYNLRDRFESGTIDIDSEDDDLAAQLCAIKVQYIAGRVQIESKKDMQARGLPSPDDADAVMLSFIRGEKVKRRGVWGTRSKRAS